MVSKKILFIPQGVDNNIASYRIRCLAVARQLKMRGYDVSIGSFAQSPSTIVLSKNYGFGAIHAAIEMKERYGARVILDLCDNHLWIDDTNQALKVRRDGLLRALEISDAVVFASLELFKHFECLTSHQRVKIIPDMIDPILGEFDVRNLVTGSRKGLVWFGNHGSPGVPGGMSDLDSVAYNVDRYLSRANTHLTIVSNNYEKYKAIFKGWKSEVRYAEWGSLEGWSALRHSLASIIPIRINPFTVVKTANRISTSFELGLVPFATAIPSYEIFRECAYLDKWEMFDQNDLSIDSHMVDLGRFKNRVHFSPSVITSSWETLLSEL